MAGHAVRRGLGNTFAIYHSRRNATNSPHFSALNEYTFDAVDEHTSRQMKNGKWLMKGGQAGKVEESNFGASKVLPSANANNRARTSGRSPVRRPTFVGQLFSASCRHYHTSSSSPRPHPPPPTSTTPSTSSFLLPRASPRSSHASEPLLPDRHHDCASAPCNNSWTTRVYTDVSLPPTRAVAATGNPSIALRTLNK
jgi:hypothetical protein